MNGNSRETPKNKKHAVYVLLGLYLLFGTLILAESAVPSAASGNQSNAFSNALAWVVNIFSPSVEGKQIEPSAFAQDENGDTTLLSKDESGVSQIALGTTSLLTYTATYPEKSAYDFYDQAYTVTRTVGGTDDYDLYPSQDTVNHKFYLRITGKTVSSTPYKVTITMGDALSQDYSFKVVDLPRPMEGYYEAHVEKSTLKVGEHEKLDVILSNPKATSSTDGMHQSDWYLRRYFDPRKLFTGTPAFTLTPEDEAKGVLKLSEDGFLYGQKEGKVTLHYGAKSLDITVQGTVEGTLSNFALAKANDHAPYMNDYDFIGDTDTKGAVQSYFSRSDGGVYWTTLKASFTSTSALSKGDLAVHFASSDETILRIFPFAIDSASQAASWFDEEGNPACQAVAYRLPGNQESDVTVVATSLALGTSKTLTLHVGKAVPTAMSLSGVPSSGVLSTNAQISLSGNFDPANAGDKRLKGTSSDPSIISLSGDGTSTLFLLGKKEGSATIVVQSVANPALSESFTLTVKNPSAINESNFTDFASVIRKAAGHFTLFLLAAVLGELFFLFFFADPKKDLLALGFGCAVGFLWAGFSELIQYLGDLFFSAGRGGAWSDVGIDTLGYVVGALLTWGIVLLIRRIRKKKKGQTPIQ